MKKKLCLKFLALMAIITLSAICCVTLISATDCIVGDMNADGKLDSNDAIYLLRHTLNSDRYPISQQGDMNSDGLTDSNDAIYLLRHTLDSQKYPLPQDTHIHSWTNKTIEATCNSQGYTLRSCECGASEKVDYTSPDPLKHKWGDALPEYRATCLENGYIVRLCSACRSLSDKEPEKAIGHDWVAATCTEAQYCNVCHTEGEPATGHHFGENPETKDPATCAKDGFATYKCTNASCNERSTQTLPATGHLNINWSGVISTVPVSGTSCLYANIESGICANCNTSVTRGEENTFYKHTEAVAITPATCTTDGEKVYNCNVCGKEAIRTESFSDSTAHSWNNGALSADGSSTAYGCTLCGATKISYNESTATINVSSIDALEVGGATITPDENAKAGLSDKDITLSVSVLSKNEIDGLDAGVAERIGDGDIYDLSMTDGSNQITTFDGSITVRVPYALEDGDDPENIVVWFIDDNGEVEEIKATYEDGFAVFSTTHFSFYTVTKMTAAERCALYGHNYIGDTTVTDVNGNEYKITRVPATCATGGYDVRLCSRCGKKTTENPTNALGHDWNITSQELTCTESGFESYDCKRCDVEYSVTVEAPGHDWRNEEDDRGDIKGTKARYKSPSCTKAGEHYVVCDRCDAEYREELPQKEHKYIEETVAPTCDNQGYTHHGCKDCGDEFTSNRKAAKGHTWNKWGHCTTCGKDCKHNYVNGECKHCHSKQDIDYPEIAATESYEMGDHTLTLFLDKKDNLIKVAYEERSYYSENGTTSEFTYTEDGTVAISTNEFYIVDNTSKLVTFDAGEAWIGYELSGNAKITYTEADYTRTYTYQNDEWILTDETVGDQTVTDVYTSKEVYYFFRNSDTNEFSVTGHTISESTVSTKETEVYFDADLGEEVTKTTYIDIDYCSVCGAEAAKYVEYRILTKDGLYLKEYESEYICADGVETLITEYVWNGSIKESTVVEGQRYELPVSSTITRYLVDGTPFISDSFSCEVGENCNYTVTETHLDGTVEIHEVQEHIFVNASYELAEGSVSCEDGIIETRLCLACGETNTYYDYYHQTCILTQTVDLAPYGCSHNGTLQKYECLCGQTSNVAINDINCDFDYRYEYYYDQNDVHHEVTYYECTECSLSFKKDSYYTYENCHEFWHRDYTIGDVVVINISEDVGTYHSWIRETVRDECFSKIIDGKYVLTSTSRRICSGCGAIESKTQNVRTYSDNTTSNVIHSKQTYYEYIGNSYVVSQIMTYEYAIATSKATPGKEFSYLTRRYRAYYELDGSSAPIYWEEHTFNYVDDDYCTRYISCTDSDGNSDTYVEEEHVATANKYVLHDPNGSCINNLDYISYCLSCGEIFDREPSYIDYHPISFDGSYDVTYKLSDYGHTCDSYLTVKYCPCGDEYTISRYIKKYGVSTKYETVDGISHRIRTYTCRENCSATLTEEFWEVKDEYCNAIEHYIYSIGDEVLVVLEQAIGQSHSSIYKELPDEYIDSTDPVSGIRTVQTAEEEYCKDCLASLRKIITTKTYGADGKLQKETIAEFRYEAVSPTETVAIPEYTKTYNYAWAELANSPSKGRSYIASGEYFQYNNAGTAVDYSETSVYSYPNGNYCEAVITTTDSNGSVSQSTEVCHTDDQKTVYELMEGSTHCYDGVTKYEVCYDCGNKKARGSYYNHKHFASEVEIERIDLSEYGSVYGTEMVIYDCICGNAQVAEIVGECEFVIQKNTYYMPSDGKEYHFISYGCPITDPHACGFEYTTTTWSESDENCNEIVHTLYNFGADEWNEEGIYSVEITQTTKEKRHKQEAEETFTDEKLITTERCSVCGEITRLYTVENYEYTIEEFYYDSTSGNLIRKDSEKGFLIGNEQIETSLGIEEYDSNGNVEYWYLRTFEYPKADEGNFCYTLERITNSYTDINHATTKEATYHKRMTTPGNRPCVPGGDTTNSTKCLWCNEYVERSGHRYSYNSQLELYVCTSCGLESASGVDGDVIFADYTFKEGNGTDKNYIIGYVNNYGDNFVWNVSLVVPGTDDFVILDGIMPTQISQYRLTLDAQEIAQAAAALGYDCCEYMVRLAFVPTDSDEPLDFAITLDPHILTLNEELSTDISDPCSQSGILVYDCILCEKTSVEEKEHIGKHNMIYDRRCVFSFDENNKLINGELTIIGTNICSVCGYVSSQSIDKETFLPNGRLSESYYKHSSSSGWNQSTTVYNYQNGTYTETDESSYSDYVYVYVYDIETNTVFSHIVKDKNGNIIDTTVYEHILHNGQYYVSLTISTQEDGDWNKYIYQYDFENMLRTETHTSNWNDITQITVQDMTIGRKISYTTYDQNGNVIDKEFYEYIIFNDQPYVSFTRYEDKDGYWRECTYEYEFDHLKNEWVKQTRIRTDSYSKHIAIEALEKTFVDNSSYVSKQTWITKNASDGSLVSKETNTYGFFFGSSHITSTLIEYADGSWSKTIYNYDFAANICTQTYTNSNGDTFIEKIPIYN